MYSTIAEHLAITFYHSVGLLIWLPFHTSPSRAERNHDTAKELASSEYLFPTGLTEPLPQQNYPQWPIYNDINLTTTYSKISNEV